MHLVTIVFPRSTQSRPWSIHRGISIALLLFHVVWLGIVVPGHRRGIVPMPGWRPEVVATTGQPDTPTDHGAGFSGSVRSDSERHCCQKKKSSANCAVCEYFLRTLPLPAVAVIGVASPTYIAPAQDPRPESVNDLPQRFQCMARGPPRLSTT